MSHYKAVYLRETLLFLEGLEFFFKDFTIDAVIFQILKKSIIFEPRKATTEFGHATRQDTLLLDTCYRTTGQILLVFIKFLLQLAPFSSIILHSNPQNTLVWTNQRPFLTFKLIKGQIILVEILKKNCLRTGSFVVSLSFSVLFILLCFLWKCSYKF